MFILRSKLAILATAGIFLLPAHLPVEAKPARRQVNQPAAPRPAAPRPASKPADPYQAAKKDLSEDWYVLYRIVDRLARANGLDEHPWRITISPEYEINAFATDGNLVAVYDGILDHLGSDSSAIACVVGHEMAHHVKRHIAVGEAQKVALVDSIKKEAEAQARAELNAARRSNTTRAIVGIFIALTGRDTSNEVQRENQQRLNQANQRIEQIVAQKKKELEQRLAAQQRQQEFEADELGYQFVAKAGFDPQGCLRTMGVLARTPGAEFDTDHPAIGKRIERLKELMVQYPPEILALEGKIALGTSRSPLTYNLSKDGKSLRINSSYGGSATDDLNLRFGQ